MLRVVDLVALRCGGGSSSWPGRGRLRVNVLRGPVQLAVTRVGMQQSALRDNQLVGGSVTLGTGTFTLGGGASTLGSGASTLGR